MRVMRTAACGLVLFACAVAAQELTVTADPKLPDYVQKSLNAAQIRSVGSSTLTTLINRWDDDFRRIHANITFNVTGGGSGTAPVALMAGEADIAPMSRPMTAKEVADFKAKFGYEPTRVVVALDALAIFVHKDNPVKQLTLKQLDALYSRVPKRGGMPATRWGEVGVENELKERAIVLRGPSTTHGMYSLFREMVLQNGEYRYEMASEPVSSAILQGVGADEAAIGFASVVYATRRTRIVPIAADDNGEALQPTQANIESGRYPLTRQLFVYVNKKPGDALQPAVLAFLSYVCSRQGQAGLAGQGGIPLNAELAQRECLDKLIK